MDNESGESTGEDEVEGVGRDESELERLVRGCRREADSRDEMRHTETNDKRFVRRITAQRAALPRHIVLCIGE